MARSITRNPCHRPGHRLFAAFSHAGLYQQSSSEYGEEFTAEQAQHAVDTVSSP
ncbi:Ltp family lipoprotein [Corynebacterium sp.]|uniref:Ltp family lipoprotein n=1 Tax=Corynebacterium sp. TaxID=1720 RepID=UPI00373580D2